MSFSFLKLKMQEQTLVESQSNPNLKALGLVLWRFQKWDGIGSFQANLSSCCHTEPTADRRTHRVESVRHNASTLHVVQATNRSRIKERKGAHLTGGQHWHGNRHRQRGEQVGFQVSPEGVTQMHTVDLAGGDHGAAGLEWRTSTLRWAGEVQGLVLVAALHRTVGPGSGTALFETSEGVRPTQLVSAIYKKSVHFKKVSYQDVFKACTNIRAIFTCRTGVSHRGALYWRNQPLWRCLKWDGSCPASHREKLLDRVGPSKEGPGPRDADLLAPYARTVPCLKMWIYMRVTNEN